MTCLPKTAAARRYTRRLLLTMVAYALLLIVVVFAFKHYHPTGALAYMLALLPAIPIIGVMAVVGLYLAEEKDEFQRNLLIQTMLWAIGATLATTSIWGFLEEFVNIPHLQPYLVFTLFWMFVGFAAPFISRRYR